MSKLEEVVLDFINTYEEVRSDHSFVYDQQLHYSRDSFYEEMRRFFLGKKQHECNFYWLAKPDFRAHSRNTSRQNRLLQYLQIVTLKGIVSSKSCDVSETRKKVRNVITDYKPQISVSDRTEKAQVEFLYYSIVTTSRTNTALTQCYTHDSPWALITFSKNYWHHYYENDFIFANGKSFQTSQTLYCVNHKECITNLITVATRINDIRSKATINLVAQNTTATTSFFISF